MPIQPADVSGAVTTLSPPQRAQGADAESARVPQAVQICMGGM